MNDSILETFKSALGAPLSDFQTEEEPVDWPESRDLFRDIARGNRPKSPIPLDTLNEFLKALSYSQLSDIPLGRLFAANLLYRLHFWLCQFGDLEEPEFDSFFESLSAMMLGDWQKWENTLGESHELFQSLLSDMLIAFFQNSATIKLTERMGIYDERHQLTHWIMRCFGAKIDVQSILSAAWDSTAVSGQFILLDIMVSLLSVEDALPFTVRKNLTTSSFRLYYSDMPGMRSQIWIPKIRPLFSQEGLVDRCRYLAEYGKEAMVKNDALILLNFVSTEKSSIACRLKRAKSNMLSE